MNAPEHNLKIAARQHEARIRVMIVDDSRVARSVLERMLSRHDDIEIVCSAENSDAASDYLKQDTVDIMLLDIEMPGRTGLEALPDLLDASDGARIMMVSSFAERNGPAAIKALSLGACDTLAKPGRTGYSGDFSRQLIAKIVRLGRKSERRNIPADHKCISPDALSNLNIPDCIAIGASTGGIPAIYHILEKLDRRIDCPIFITQHLPAPFMAFFAKQLSALAGRDVLIAKPGAEVAAGKIYIAAGDAHLCVTRQGDMVAFRKPDASEESRYCPSVDVMLNSLSDVYASKLLAIVLSGMGNDGAASAQSVKDRGADIIVQDAESSVVWGMPGAIAQQGLASAILKAPEIVQLLNRAVVAP
ncbi:MAG: chemotaxis-specific protein-glutamate methyltransferase CheB [Sphingorhabdus sp.]